MDPIYKEKLLSGTAERDLQSKIDLLKMTMIEDGSKRKMLQQQVNLNSVY